MIYWGMIYVIRHGKTEGGQKGNVPLNTVGIAQARAVAPLVAKLSVGCIYTSDVLRAVQTTEEINKVAGLEVVLDSRLREFSILTDGFEGVGNIKDLDNLTGGEQLEFLGALSQEQRLALGKALNDSFKDAFERVRSFIAELRAKEIDNVAVITHRGIISTFAYCLENDEFDFKRFDENRKKYKEKGMADNCTIVEFDLYN